MKDARAIDRWLSGAETCNGADVQLRVAYTVARTLGEGEHPRVVQAWFTGLNPQLDDRAPIRLLAEGNEADAKAVLLAARAFRAAGSLVRGPTENDSLDSLVTTRRADLTCTVAEFLLLFAPRRRHRKLGHV